MSQLRRNRLLLLASLALLGASVGVTVTLLSPDGFVRARRGEWRGVDAVAGLGNRAGLRFCALVDDAGHTQPLRGCHSYQPPEVVDVAGRRLAVWEHDDDHVAVSRLGPELTLVDTVLVPRPRTSLGTLLPRSGVRVEGDRLTVRYLGGHEIRVDRDLEVWPGGAPEVAGVRLGRGAFVVLFGLVALLAFYLGAAGWTFGLPARLRASRRRGRCLEAVLPTDGAAVLVDGRPWELDLEGARSFGGRLTDRIGKAVTLVLRKPLRVGDAYRQHDRLQVAQVWPGDFAEALGRARAVRTGATAMVVLAAAALLLALDAYLVV